MRAGAAQAARRDELAARRAVLDAVRADLAEQLRELDRRDSMAPTVPTAGAPDLERFVSRGRAAKVLKVDPKTIGRWAARSGYGWRGPTGALIVDLPALRAWLLGQRGA